MNCERKWSECGRDGVARDSERAIWFCVDPRRPDFTDAEPWGFHKSVFRVYSFLSLTSEVFWRKKASWAF